MGLIHDGARVPVTPETTERHRAALGARLAQGPLPDAPNGQVLAEFAPEELGLLLEQAAQQGHEKIQIAMAREDAVRFAAFLRRAYLAGVPY
jgi:hypothetical protein